MTNKKHRGPNKILKEIAEIKLPLADVNSNLKIDPHIVDIYSDRSVEHDLQRWKETGDNDHLAYYTAHILRRFDDEAARAASEIIFQHGNSSRQGQQYDPHVDSDYFRFMQNWRETMRSLGEKENWQDAYDYLEKTTDGKISADDAEKLHNRVKRQVRDRKKRQKLKKLSL